MFRYRSLTGLLLLMPLALVTLAGCPFSPTKGGTKPPPVTQYLPQTTITNVLANLTRSYQEKNYDEYRKLLDAAYEYNFALQDIDPENNIPPSWGLADELVSAENMLGGVPNKDGYRAEEISLSFTAGADTPTEQNPLWRKVILSEVNLRIVGRNETSADPLIYDVRGDKAELYFVQSGETAPGTTQKIWTIVRWDDKPIAVAIAAKF